MSDKAYLVFELNHSTKTFPISRPSIIIGRSYECDLVLSAGQISRQHAKIFKKGGQYFIEDLNSVNGTFVNDEPIQISPLHNGDRIKLGEIPLSFINPIHDQINLSDEFETDSNMTISFPISSFIPEKAEIAKLKTKDVDTTVRLILDAAKSLIQSNDLDEILTRVMDLVFEFLKADRAFLMLFDENRNCLIPTVAKSRKKRDKINFSSTIVNQVFNEGVSILTANAMKDKRFSAQESVMMQQIRSCMCVPLWDEKKIIGILYVDSLFAENMFRQHDLDILSTIAIISAIAIEQARLNDEIQKSNRIKERLLRYHSPSVVEKILQQTEDGVIRTEEREISVLFADLVDFTALSEKLTPHEIIKILNTFFSNITEVIFKYDGTLDKYIGDGLMAVFGVPFPQADHAERAVNTAVDMFEVLQEMNKSAILPVTLDMRVGINSGRVVAGDVGSKKRVDYTVLGNTVNIASRIESTIAKGGEIVIGSKTKELLGDKFKLAPLGLMKIKGLSSPMEFFKVLRG